MHFAELVKAYLNRITFCVHTDKDHKEGQGLFPAAFIHFRPSITSAQFVSNDRVAFLFYGGQHAKQVDCYVATVHIWKIRLHFISWLGPLSNVGNKHLECLAEESHVSKVMSMWSTQILHKFFNTSSRLLCVIIAAAYETHILGVIWACCTHCANHCQGVISR